ncbi:hypothetical protein BU17DRAFT_87669 [Hysterangium stoloniferum]|nr:hypothetical protein BU17DRAFT_87669 [Hysterangium stoloniferum]
MVMKAMAHNIGPWANVAILLLGVFCAVKILAKGTFILRLSHYPQAAELIAHLRCFATHTLAVSLASYIKMCGYVLHNFVTKKLFSSSLPPAPVADVSSSSKLMALFKIVIEGKIDPYYANFIVYLLPVNVSSQVVLRTCYRQSLAPVRGSLWGMLAQSPMPADVIDQVIRLFSGVEHS